MSTTPPSTPGALAKMLINAYDPQSDSDEPVHSYVMMFNPSSFDEDWTYRWTIQQPQGTSGAFPVFNIIAPQSYNFEFLVDGTGAAGGPPVNVYDNLTSFLSLIGSYVGTEHRPRYCRLTWGSFTATCVLERASISYLMFASNGWPLRAKVRALFKSIVNNVTREASEKKSSPDVTHQWKVTRGDRLPAIARKIYGDPRYYLQLAAYNGLDNFRQLSPGSVLMIPSLDVLRRLTRQAP